MDIINKIKQRLLKKDSGNKIDDDVLLNELSDFVDKLFDSLGDEKTEPEMYPQIIKNYDEAITLLQKYLEHHKKATQAKLNFLIAVESSASFHRKVCEHAKETFEIQK